MTVKELIVLLETADPNDIIIMSKDAEGNCYSPLADFETGFYTPETSCSWQGEFSNKQYGEKTKKCITFFPIN